MRKRHRMTKKSNRNVFKKGNRIHKRNVRSAPMRGGIRL